MASHTGGAERSAAGRGAAQRAPLDGHGKMGKRAGKERGYFFNPHSAARRAVVIGHIGGLLISTFVTIVFVPIL